MRGVALMGSRFPFVLSSERELGDPGVFRRWPLPGDWHLVAPLSGFIASSKRPRDFRISPVLPPEPSAKTEARAASAVASLAGGHLSWGFCAPSAPSTLRVLLATARSDTVRTAEARRSTAGPLSAFGVSHPLGGLLLAAPRRFVSPGRHSWGSHAHGPDRRSPACAGFPQARAVEAASRFDHGTPRSVPRPRPEATAARKATVHVQPSRFRRGARSEP